MIEEGLQLRLRAQAASWLEEALSASGAGAALTLMPMALASFLRLVTSPKIFQLATPIEDAARPVHVARTRIAAGKHGRQDESPLLGHGANSHPGH